MMIDRLLSDATIRPTLFIWNGPINPERLDVWALANRWRLPDDLRAFWVATGGGEMFETETMLGPFVDAVKGNAAHLTDTDVVQVRESYPNFAAWYDGLIRAEYAARYGLPD